jgi:hypothetical protein
MYEEFDLQVDEACKKIKENPNFQGEFNVVGLS